MRNRCPKCNFGRAYTLGDGRRKCRSCGYKFSVKTSVWNHFRIPSKTKRQLLEYFVLGVPVYRARFRITCSLKTAERFYRAIRAVLAYYEQQTEPLDGILEMDESPFWWKKKGETRLGSSWKDTRLWYHQT